MTTYMITSSAGLNMGIFTAETPRDALDMLARDAGWDSHQKACAVCEDDPDDWTERQADEGAGYERLIVLG